MVSSEEKEMNDLEKCQILYDYLRGMKMPEGFVRLSHLHLSSKAAFGVIYIIQEALGILSDEIEQCSVCKDLYDSACEGIYGGDGGDYDDTKRKAKYHGKFFCENCIPEDLWKNCDGT